MLSLTITHVPVTPPHDSGQERVGSRSRVNHFISVLLLSTLYSLFCLLTTNTHRSHEGDIPKPIRSAHHNRHWEPKCGRIQETIHPSIFPTINESKASVEILDPFTGIGISFHITSKSTITAELQGGMELAEEGGGGRQGREICLVSFLYDFGKLTDGKV